MQVMVATLADMKSRGIPALTLVERFLEFQNWPTSKKSALLYGLALPFHVVCTIWVSVSIEQYPWVDLDLMEAVYWIWNLELGAAFVISLFVARKGHEGYWTLWLNAIPYYFFMVVAISLFGFGSIAFAAWVPSLLVLVTVWYGLRDGLISFFYMLGLILGCLVLLQLDLIPYAPALLDRSIDAQNDWVWMFHVFFITLLYFSFCFALVVLLISARRVQERRLKETRQQLRRSNEVISRYVPAQVVHRILGDHNHESFRPVRAKLTIFFSQIEGFTEASDKLDPEDLSAVLNEYLSAMAEIAGRHGAAISQFVADGIMIFFGGPRDGDHEGNAMHAVRMALEMQQRVEHLQDLWEKRGISRRLRTRMGINTGYASVGDFGSEDRKVYTAIGVQANIAALIQASCEPGRILLRDSTWALVRDQVVAKDMGELKLKGIHMPVHVHELQGLA